MYDHAIAPEYDTYMGEIFEWIGREYLSHYAPDPLPAPTRDVGKIWGADYDIDLAATLLDDTVVFGECKWWDSPVGKNILEALRADARQTDYADDSQPVQWLLLAKSGFTEELERHAADTGDLHLLTPADLLDDSAP